MSKAKHKQTLLEYAYQKNGSGFTGVEMTEDMTGKLTEREQIDSMHYLSNDEYIDSRDIQGDNMLFTRRYYITHAGRLFYEDGGYIEQEKRQKKEKRKQNRIVRWGIVLTIIFGIPSIIAIIPQLRNYFIELIKLIKTI